MPAKFEDYSIQVKGVIGAAMKRFLREAAFVVESDAKQNTPNEKKQLQGSWSSTVKDNEAEIGSPLEDSFWNEFGTGSYAVHGDGRKGWWVYIKGQPRGSKNSKVYPNEKEAQKAVAFLRSKGLPAVATNGEEPHRTLQNAFTSKKEAIKRRAEAIMQEELGK